MTDENKHIQRKHYYKNNYLTDVILRIDFNKIKIDPSTINKLKSSLQKKLPVLQQIARKEIKFKIKGSTTFTEENDTLYKFVDNDSSITKFFEFDNSHLAYSDNKYINHSSFKDAFKEIIEFFMKDVDELRINRIGLRYINQIHIDEKEPYELDNLIDKKLSSILKVNPLGKPIIRSMNSTEFRIDDEIRLIFRYGLFNKEYPSVPTRKEFVLDFDCYSTFIDKIEQTYDFLDKANIIMAKYFESSISEGLRKEYLHEEPNQEK